MKKFNSFIFSFVLLFSFFLLGCNVNSETSVTSSETTSETISTTQGSSTTFPATSSITETTTIDVTTTESSSTNTSETTTTTTNTTAQTTTAIASVSFEMGVGNAREPIFVTVGSTYGSLGLIDPMHDNYFFGGFYTDDDFLNRIDSSDIITQNITLYAKWIPIQYPISFYTAVIENDYDLVLWESERIIDIITAGDNTIILSSRGRVFTTGYNQWGLLGDGTFTNSNVIIDITDHFNIVNDKIIEIAMSEDFAYAITLHNQVYFWGHNSSGVQDTGSNLSVNIPQNVTGDFMLNEDEEIIEINPGNGFVVVLTNQNRVLVRGNNSNGQLGTGDTTNRYAYVDITANFSLGVNEEFIDIVTGRVFSLALTSENRLFAWGGNYDGELGLGDNIDRFSPTEITNQFVFETSEVITHISAGWYHSMVVTNLNKIYTFGSNTFGELGNNSTVSSNVPVDITDKFVFDYLETIKSIELGSSMSGLVTSYDKVYTWGFNTYGNLGNGTFDLTKEPRGIMNQFNLNYNEVFLKITLGWNHGGIVTNQGRMFIWGDNGYGQIGNQTNTSSNTPVNIGAKPYEITYLVEYDYNELIDSYIPNDINGYTFIGWYEDYDLTIPYIFDVMLSGGIMVYGVYKKD